MPPTVSGPVSIGFGAIYALSTVLCTLGLTRLMTEIDSRYRRWRGRPALVPYWIPFIGNAIEFVKDPRAFLSKYQCVHQFQHDCIDACHLVERRMDL